MTRTPEPVAAVRPDWLSASVEEAIDPGRPIVDAHHHLFDRPGLRYLADDFLQDLAGGHDVRSTVFVQARAMYRLDGPPALRPVGESEFAAGVAAACAGERTTPRLCAAIVAYADLTLGDAVRPVLAAHAAACDGRLRGIRHIACWDPDAALLNPAYPTDETLLDSPSFRAGFAALAEFGLSFDAWIFFHQIPRLAALARAFPTVPIVLDHCGGIPGIRGYAGRRDEVFHAWSRAIGELAGCGNVTVKLGGLGMPLSGFGFHLRPRAPSSADLAEAWRPWMERCIGAFGTDRCMFESNFPVDKVGYAYANGWNAMKRIASGAGDREADDLFRGTAARVYRLAGTAG